MYKKILYTYILLLLLILPGNALSQMESTNYRIDFDSVNTGGEISTSTNYRISDTMGEVATGDSDSTNYQMRAGYQQMNTSFISISGLTSEILPNMSGIVAGTSATSTSVTVTTDNYGGYQLTMSASTTPALTAGVYSFDDYSPAGASPDYVFIIDTNSSQFGFSVAGDDVDIEFLNNGAVCGVGGSSTPQRCWRGLDTTPILISETNSSNHPTGVATDIYYQSSVGSNKIQEAGVYQADITLTATVL